jgi:hypothetical protein
MIKFENNFKSLKVFKLFLIKFIVPKIKLKIHESLVNKNKFGEEIWERINL